MTNDQIADYVKDCSRTWSGENDIQLSHRFVEDLGFDSLDQVEMVMECESEFDIEITDAEAEQVKTVADAVSLIERLLASTTSEHSVNQVTVQHATANFPFGPDGNY